MRHPSPRPFPVVRAVFALGSLALALAGCGGGAANQAPVAAPAPGAPPPSASTASQLATGWKYRIDMVAPPNDNFAITTREVYLWFKPDTTAVTFQVENRLGVPIHILWDESTFLDIYGRTSKAVHRGVTYQSRDMPQEVKILAPGERYTDFVIPADLLNDPGAAAGQGARLLLPTDLEAQSMVGRSFGPTLVLTGENGERLTFATRFRVVSVYQER